MGSLWVGLASCSSLLFQGKISYISRKAIEFTEWIIKMNVHSWKDVFGREAFKISCAKLLQSCLTLCNCMDHGLPGFSVHEDSPGKNTGMGCHALLQGNLPNPGIKPRKPNDTEVGSLSLLQGIFPTQESNRGLLHCRWILYQFRYQGSSSICPQNFLISENL